MSAAGYIDPDQRKHPSAYTAAHLRQMIVEDAVRSHATHLPWMVAALQIIAKAESKGTSRGLDETFESIVLEVEGLTGRRDMPLHSGRIL